MGFWMMLNEAVKYGGYVLAGCEGSPGGTLRETKGPAAERRNLLPSRRAQPNSQKVLEFLLISNLGQHFPNGQGSTCFSCAYVASKFCDMFFAKNRVMISQSVLDAFWARSCFLLHF